ncbi:hypothetical protein NQ318_009228 [Aromia moschata]|uniref:Rotatin N-terminal domain-containing protein n=1 Tax=Aromia moschata TaxID=1265417 RepID=A0AAV8YAS0_9CUCU|nr:hypothetical protein NQ318_009228 [Aromia moschata]
MMSEKFISSAHIKKLEHKIQEIRERALVNIISKLDNGVSFDNDLARSKELLSKLFHWFLLEPCSMEEVVFSLLKRILKSESGKILIKHCGREALRKELSQIRSYIEPQYYPHLDELSRLIDEQEREFIVPPLESDVPLSYRTDTSSANQRFLPTVGSTATPYEGLIQEEASVDRQMGVDKLLDIQSQKDNMATYRLNSVDENKSKNSNNLPNYMLQWQPLIEADRHVLQSIENSLKNPPQPLTLLHSCDFFINVLLHDFPAEIFLQRPSIIMGGINLCLMLLEELLDLLCLTVKIDIWDQQQNETTLKVLRGFNEVMVQYGEALEYFRQAEVTIFCFRLESVTSDTNLTFRVIYLYLVHNCANLLIRLIPLSKTGLILPRNLKIALSNTILDVTLSKLHPEVHSLILEYVESYCVGNEIDPLKKYREVRKVCQGMTATVRFLKEHKSLGTSENLRLAKAALPSIEFHEDFDFIRDVVEICSEKVSLVSDKKITDTAEGSNFIYK